MVMASADNDSMDRLLESFLSISDPGISIGLSLKQVVELKMSKSEMFILSSVSIEFEVDKIQIAIKCMNFSSMKNQSLGNFNASSSSTQRRSPKSGMLISRTTENFKMALDLEAHCEGAQCEEGIVVGGGCALLRLASKVDTIKDSLYGDEQKVGADIVKRTLSYSLKLIAKNAGVNGSVVTEKVLANDNLKFGYKCSNC